MADNNHLVEVATDIEAPVEKVWDALINPAVIKEYMFGTIVKSEWKAGSRITWSGEWEGKPYEDHGTIREINPPHQLSYTHIAGSNPEDEHTVTIRLTPSKDIVHLSLIQDNNKSEKEKTDSEKNWNMMLASMKTLLEKNN